MIQESNKIHEKDHYYEVVSESFFRMIEKFMRSTRTFSEIIDERIKKIQREISEDLRELLRDYIDPLIDGHFNEGFYPDRSPFEKIPLELRQDVYLKYGDEILSFPLEKFFWKVVLDYYVTPFLKDINDSNYDFKKVMNKILKKVPKDTREAIMEEYYNKNWPIMLEIKEEIPVNESKRDLAKDILLRNLNSDLIIKREFFELSAIEKKVIIDIVWDLNVDFDKRYGGFFTDQKISSIDKDKLLNIAVDDYIDAYETVKADFLEYFKK